MILQSAPVSWAFMVIATTVVKIALAIPETMEVIQTPSSCHMGVRRARDTMGNTGMLGGYDPGRALLQETESGEVLTSFRDTCYQRQDDHNINQREMLIGGKVFHVTSVFPMEATATPTDKLLSLIDTDLKKEAHSA